jgi:hypothetical protein
MACAPWLGCAGADGRRTPARLSIPGPAACGSSSPAPAFAPAGGTGLTVGLHASLRYFDGRALCRLARLSRSLGARIVREDVRWPAAEPRRGTFAWGVTDRTVAAAARQGLVVLPILGNGTRAWARGGRAAAYARFVRAAVLRYGPGGVFWREHPELPAAAAPVWFELWNEPYEPANRARLSVAAYAALIAQAVPAGHAANARARFLVAAEHRPGELDWTARLLARSPTLAGADGVTVHAYGAVPPPSSPPTAGAADGDTAVTRVEGVRAELVAAGLARLPVWITEAGASTCRGGQECVAQTTQAQRLDRLFTYARTRWRPYVRALVVYALQDLAGARLADKEGSFGLIRADGTAKPARAVFVRRARN